MIEVAEILDHEDDNDASPGIQEHVYEELHYDSDESMQSNDECKSNSDDELV